MESMICIKVSLACDGWGVSADYSVSFDWVMDELPTKGLDPGDNGDWFNILHIGERKHSFFFNLCKHATHTLYTKAQATVEDSPQFSLPKLIGSNLQFQEVQRAK